MRELFRILSLTRNQRSWLLAGLALGLAVIAANALLMALSGWFIASMAVAGVTGASFNYFFPAAAIRALAIVRTVGRYGERLVTHEAAFHVLADLRTWLFARLAPLAPAVLERYAGGDVAGRLRADVDSLESVYLRIAAPLAIGATTLPLACLFVAAWSGPAALLLLFFLLLAGVALPLWARRMAELPGHTATARAGELRTAVTEGLLGAEELLLLGAEERHAARIDALSRDLVRHQERLGTIGALSQAGSGACAGFALAAMLPAACWSVSTGRIGGPALVMILLFAAAVFEAVGPLSAALQQLPAAGEAIRRIRELADSPPPVPDPPSPSPLPAEPALAFRNVSFSYRPDLPALQGFSLSVAAGERVALVGPSGSGKSTLLEILLRFREYDGSITLGGTELRTIAGDDLRRMIAALPQKPHLFNATIRENILVGNRAAGEEELRNAIADAGLERWVAGLPEGLETMVGEGGNRISGGEARRIALARALLKDAPLLLLDEPTEGLDAAAEREVVGRLGKRTRGMTVLVATHRPACLALADRAVRLYRKPA